VCLEGTQLEATPKIAPSHLGGKWYIFLELHSLHERGTQLKPSKLGFSEASAAFDRWCLFITFPQRQNTIEEKRLANRRIAAAEDRINKDLARIAQDIALNADRPIKPVRVLLLLGKGADGHVADYMSQHPNEKACMVRAFVSLEPVPDERAIALSGLSHLVQVEIEPRANRRGWHPGGAIAQAVVHTTEEEWPLVVEDVLLDVSMARCMPGPVIASDIEGQEFSKRKVQYAESLGKPTYYGPIHRTPQYISLASFARSGTAFDCYGYVKHWQAMVSSERPPTTSTSARPSVGPPAKIFVPGQRVELPLDHVTLPRETIRGVVDNILAFHTKRGQLSRSRLTKLVAQLKPGAYFLLRAERKPRRKLAALQLSYFFGRGIWKTGRLAVFEGRDLKRYWPYQPYVSIYRFEVPKPNAAKKTSAAR
jgi:hypothetical protein